MAGPAYRVIAVRKNDKDDKTVVATLWPGKFGNLNLKLGNKPYKDDPGCSEKEAADLLGSGDYWLNVYPAGGGQRRDQAEQPGDIDDFEQEVF